VITSQELNQLRTEWGLGTHTIEKDYVLGWVLAAIANGTCGYRPRKATRLMPTTGTSASAAAGEASWVSRDGTSRTGVE
jgi:hypothetical protein